MRVNPLTTPIMQILRQHPDGISEYQLLKQLEFEGLALEAEISPDLQLYRKHFLVMNALWQLQPVLLEEGCYLSISALKIILLAAEDRSAETLPASAGEQAIRDYYLDWSQFDDSSAASVETLLNSFWQRYFAEERQQQALSILELTENCSWGEIRSAWRRLAAVHHPDRGGEAERFRQVREAYELLACCRRQQ